VRRVRNRTTLTNAVLPSLRREDCRRRSSLARCGRHGFGLPGLRSNALIDPLSASSGLPSGVVSQLSGTGRLVKAGTRPGTNDFRDWNSAFSQSVCQECSASRCRPMSMRFGRPAARHSNLVIETSAAARRRFSAAPWPRWPASAPGRGVPHCQLFSSIFVYAPYPRVNIRVSFAREQPHQCCVSALWLRYPAVPLRHMACSHRSSCTFAKKSAHSLSMPRVSEIPGRLRLSGR